MTMQCRTTPPLRSVPIFTFVLPPIPSLPVPMLCRDGSSCHPYHCNSADHRQPSMAIRVQQVSSHFSPDKLKHDSLIVVNCHTSVSFLIGWVEEHLGVDQTSGSPSLDSQQLSIQGRPFHQQTSIPPIKGRAHYLPISILPTRFHNNHIPLKLLPNSRASCPTPSPRTSPPTRTGRESGFPAMLTGAVPSWQLTAWQLCWQLCWQVRFLQGRAKETGQWTRCSSKMCKNISSFVRFRKKRKGGKLLTWIVTQDVCLWWKTCLIIRCVDLTERLTRTVVSWRMWAAESTGTSGWSAWSVSWLSWWWRGMINPWLCWHALVIRVRVSLLAPELTWECSPALASQEPAIMVGS